MIRSPSTAPARAASVSREHAGEDTPRWVVRAPDGSYVGEAGRIENAKDLARRWNETELLKPIQKDF
jgi:poly(3-hydroxybutyrate) depolymerase